MAVLFNVYRWFHGKTTGRKEAEQLITNSGGLDGSFLVRESSKFHGDYSLSFMYVILCIIISAHSIPHSISHAGIVNHVRIQTRKEGGTTKFFIDDPLGFDTLYELVDYYHNHPLKTAEFQQILTQAVPQVKKFVFLSSG